MDQDQDTLRARRGRRTSAKVRRKIQNSKENIATLARRHRLNPKTVAKWKERDSVSDAPMGPKHPRSSVLTVEDEAIILTYRRRTRLSLNDCLLRLRRLMPKLSRSALHRCLKRNGLSKIGRRILAPSIANKTMKGPCSFEITFDEVWQQVDSATSVTVNVFMAIEEVTKYVFGEVVAVATQRTAAEFLALAIADSPEQVIAVATDFDPLFLDPYKGLDEDMAEFSSHPFAKVCRDNSVRHIQAVFRSIKPVELKAASERTVRL